MPSPTVRSHSQNTLSQTYYVFWDVFLLTTFVKSADLSYHSLDYRSTLKHCTASTNAITTYSWVIGEKPFVHTAIPITNSITIRSPCSWLIIHSVWLSILYNLVLFYLVMKMRQVGKRSPQLAVIRTKTDNLNAEINGLSKKAKCQWPFQIERWLHLPLEGMMGQVPITLCLFLFIKECEEFQVCKGGKRVNRLKQPQINSKAMRETSKQLFLWKNLCRCM